MGFLGYRLGLLFYFLRCFHTIFFTSLPSHSMQGLLFSVSSPSPVSFSHFSSKIFFWKMFYLLRFIYFSLCVLCFVCMHPCAPYLCLAPEETRSGSGFSGIGVMDFGSWQSNLALLMLLGTESSLQPQILSCLWWSSWRISKIFPVHTLTPPFMLTIVRINWTHGILIAQHFPCCVC